MVITYSSLLGSKTAEADRFKSELEMDEVMQFESVDEMLWTLFCGQ